MEANLEEEMMPEDPYSRISPTRMSTEPPDSSTEIDMEILPVEYDENNNNEVTLSQDEMVSSSSDNYLKELYDEEEFLHPVECKHTLSLLKREINRVSRVCENASTVTKLFEREEERVNISEKVFYPGNREPSYDFVMTLIGPRGSNIRNIAQYTNTKISILGKGSTKDRCGEEELSKSSDPQHQHFKEPFHVLVQAAGSKHVVEPGLYAAVNKIKMYMDEDIKYRDSSSQNLPFSSPLDSDQNEKVSLTEKVLFPDSSSYNIVTWLLGPKGSNLRSIATSTKTRISILGKGSIRNKAKEAEASKSGDPKYDHLKEPLHALVQAAGPRHIAQSHLDSALTEIRRYIKGAEPGFDNTSYLPARTPFENEEFTNLSEKIFFPVDKYPSGNFIGSLLGSRGSNLKTIATSTRARISILGRGSTKDINKEKVLRNNNDPKYEHLKEPLHVLIQVAGPRNISKGRLNAAVFEINRCIDEEVNRVLLSRSDTSISSLQTDGPFDNEEFVDLTEKVYFPVEKYPTFNFIGRLLGPKGSNLRRIAAASQLSSTKTKISILGKGSTKEGALIQLNDPQYDHLKEPLHVLVNVCGPKHAAEARLNVALDEIKKYTNPDNVELWKREIHEYVQLNSPTTPTHTGGRGSNINWSDDGKKCRISYE